MDTPDAVSSTQEFRPSPNEKRVGILFVHGVGQASHSDTLIDFGRAFAGWVARWQRAQGDEPQFGEAELCFTPYDAGSDNSVPFAELHVPGGNTWVFAEAWWAASARPMPFTAMLTWSWRTLWGLVFHLFETMLRRVDRVLGNKSDYDAGWFARFVDLANAIGLAGFYLVGGFLGYLLLVPITVLAQIPYKPFQEFVLVTLFEPFLQYNASQLRVFLEDDIQAANMCRRVADAVDWLTDEARGGCQTVVLIAHSGGSWVAHGMLTDETYRGQQSRVRKLITFGSGLNKVWELAPSDLKRVRRAVAGNIFWVDFWSAYDPVPAGWLDPPRDRNRKYWPPIYLPSEEVVKAHGLKQRARPRPPDQRSGWNSMHPDKLKDEPLRGGTLNYWPESIRVMNRMDILTDHGGYFTNDEEVLRRVAAEIDSPGVYTNSNFWTGTHGQLANAVSRRRARVTWLGFVRQIAAVAGLLLAFMSASTLAGWVAAVGAIRSTADGFRGFVQFLATISGLNWLTNVADGVVSALLLLAGGALALGFAAALFEVFRAVWEWNDFNQRQALLRETVPISPTPAEPPADTAQGAVPTVPELSARSRPLQ
jgi:hypothetical protein